jgi:predicted AAA+ superfamily ATPase
MEKINRILKFGTGNYLILGPRQTGKSTWVITNLKETSYFVIDLLKKDLFKRYEKHPEQLREDIVYQIQEKKIKVVFIDEIQKIPDLFDVVHDLIEDKKITFYLSGSSAKKFRQKGINLLGGRAKLAYMFPFTYLELLEKFKLEEVLQYGSLPGIYFHEQIDKIDYLKAYVDLYLKEEIQNEALVRKFQDFSRFIDVAAIYAAQILSYKNISRDAQIAENTVKNYFKILEDTLVGYFLPAWDISVKKQLSKHPKFYFFDNGINNALLLQLKNPLHPEQRGHLFEQWMINEIRAIASYYKAEFHFHFWRTYDGTYEVDLVLSRANVIHYAIEIKGKKNLEKADFKSLIALKAEHPQVKCYLVSEVVVPSIKDDIIAIGWRDFFNDHLLKILK